MGASVFDAVRLLVGDGLVAVGRLVGGGARRCEVERLADALTDVEADVDHLEPGQLSPDLQAAVDLGINLAERAVAFGDQILAGLAEGFKQSDGSVNVGLCNCFCVDCRDNAHLGPPHCHPLRSASAAVVTPAADNTTDCGCGSGNNCPNTCRDDGVGLVDSMEAAYHYHKPVLAFSASTNREGWAEVSKTCWRCEGCSWTGPTEQAHARHRFQVLADMKAATNRVAERLGGGA